MVGGEATFLTNPKGDVLLVPRPGDGAAVDHLPIQQRHSPVGARAALRKSIDSARWAGMWRIAAPLGNFVQHSEFQPSQWPLHGTCNHSPNGLQKVSPKVKVEKKGKKQIEVFRLF